MLATVDNDNAGRLTPRGVFTTIASKLAPTRELVEIKNSHQAAWSVVYESR
jgi:hypothetical protein